MSGANTNARHLARALCAVAALAAVAVAEDTERARYDRLVKAKPGEWVIEKRTGKGSGAPAEPVFELRWVSKVEDKVVTVMTQTLDPDLKSGLSKPNLTQPTAFEPMMRRGVKTKVTEGVEVEVAGKKLKCRRLDETVTMGKLETKTSLWISDEVPLDGVVLWEAAIGGTDQTVRGELVDWGTSGGAEKPLKK